MVRVKPQNSAMRPQASIARSRAAVSSSSVRHGRMAGQGRFRWHVGAVGPRLPVRSAARRAARRRRRCRRRGASGCRPRRRRRGGAPGRSGCARRRGARTRGPRTRSRESGSPWTGSPAAGRGRRSASASLSLTPPSMTYSNVTRRPWESGNRRAASSSAAMGQRLLIGMIRSRTSSVVALSEMARLGAEPWPATISLPPACRSRRPAPPSRR